MRDGIKAQDLQLRLPSPVLEEWEEYRDKLYKLIRDGTLEEGISKIKVNTGGLILPNNH